MTIHRHYLFSQPHQPFFTLAVINALIFMALFALSYNGTLSIALSPIDLHTYSFVYLIFTPAFLGFLLTTYPRFSQMPAFLQRDYLIIFYPILFASLIYLVSALSLPALTPVAKVALLFAQIYTAKLFLNHFRNSPIPDQHDTFWILVAWISGIFANLIAIIAPIYFPKIALYLYLIFTALSVAQRMVPFFSHTMVKRDETLLRDIFLLFIAGIVLGSFPPSQSFAPIPFLIAGIRLTRRFMAWKLPFRKEEPLIWILQIALYWLALGLIVGSIADLFAQIYEKNILALSIHLIALGFLTTILIGFGTRVTLGHSGNLMQIDKGTKILFYLTQILLYFRILYSLMPNLILFDISAFLWLLLFGWWGFKYLPVLIFGKRL